MSRKFSLRKIFGDMGFLDYKPERFWVEREDGRAIEPPKWIGALPGFLKQNQCKTVLELGAGFGTNLKYVKGKLPEVTCIGCDIAGWCVEKAKVDCGSLAHFFVHDIRKRLPYKNDEIDCILCAGILMHVPPKHIGFVVSEIIRVANRAVFLYEEIGTGRPVRHENNFVFYHDYGKLFGLDEIYFNELSGSYKTIGYRI